MIPMDDDVLPPRRVPELVVDRVPPGGDRAIDLRERQAAEVTSSEKKLAEELAPGLVMADALNGVAVHNAYHLAKIVAIRQVMGAWEAGKAAP